MDEFYFLNIKGVNHLCKDQAAREAIAVLQELYQALTESDLIPVSGDLPATGEANKIYRKAGVASYSDYMWDGSDYILLATYDNAIASEEEIRDIVRNYTPS